MNTRLIDSNPGTKVAVAEFMALSHAYCATYMLTMSNEVQTADFLSDDCSVISSRLGVICTRLRLVLVVNWECER